MTRVQAARTGLAILLAACIAVYALLTAPVWWPVVVR